MSLAPYGVLVLFSVALFLLWGGPLWTAGRGASHVTRFAVSYLAVLPVAALLLFNARQLTWSHLIAATCSAWGIKLVVTSGLYFALAGGVGLAPAAPQAAVPHGEPKAAVSADYRPAKGHFDRGAIRGSLLRAGAPVSGAVVLIDDPRPGLPLLATDEPARLTIGDSRHQGAVFLARSDQPLLVESDGAALHTLHLYAGGRAILNVPIPAGERARSFTAPEPGIYDVRCDTHPAERATLVVVEHPYATRTGERGEIELAGVATGPLELLIISPSEAAQTISPVRRVAARVEAAEITVVHIDLSTPEAAQERL